MGGLHLPRRKKRDIKRIKTKGKRQQRQKKARKSFLAGFKQLQYD